MDSEPSGVALAVGAGAALGAGLPTRLTTGTGWLPALSVVLVVAIFAAGVRWLPQASWAASAVPPGLLAGWSVLPALAVLTARELPSSSDGVIPAWTAYTPDSDHYTMWKIHAQGVVELTSDHRPGFMPRPDLIVPGLIATALCLACAVWLTHHNQNRDTMDRTPDQ